MKILVADDDFVNRKFLEKILSQYGEVITVDNGMSAVDEATRDIDAEEPFGLICLDIMMTKLDGYKTLAAIRSAERKFAISKENRAKVIMISALDEVVTDTAQIREEYDAYICKPIMLDKFEAILGRMGFQKLKK